MWNCACPEKGTEVMSFSYGIRWGNCFCVLIVMGIVLVFAVFLQSGLGQ